MKTEYRHIRCPDCKTVLRITITAKNFGKMIEIPCPVCGARSQTRIPIPVLVQPGKGVPADHDSIFGDIFDLLNPKK